MGIVPECLQTIFQANWQCVADRVDSAAVYRRRRFEAPGAPRADLIVAGNHPWPGDPMQSFKVLLQHRAACRAGGVLAGFFWTDPSEIVRAAITKYVVEREVNLNGSVQ